MTRSPVRSRSTTCRARRAGADRGASALSYIIPLRCIVVRLLHAFSDRSRPDDRAADPRGAESASQPVGWSSPSLTPAVKPRVPCHSAYFALAKASTGPAGADVGNTPQSTGSTLRRPSVWDEAQICRSFLHILRCTLP